MLTDGAVYELSNNYSEIIFSFMYLLIKTRRAGFRNIKYAEIKHVLTFKQVSVTFSNFLNRKNKKTEKNMFQKIPMKGQLPYLNLCKMIGLA